MANNGLSEFIVRSARKGDLNAILSWLEGEREGNEGFWHNRDLIVAGQSRGDLVVISHKANRQIAGFLLSDGRSMYIMEIRPEFRRQGFGKTLARHGLHRIENAGEFGVIIQCEPESSIPFWKALGFQHIEHPSGRSNCYNAVYLFSKRFELSIGSDPIRVCVALYNVVSATRPKQYFERRAVQLTDGRFALDERIVAFIGSNDALAEIYVGEELVSKHKVKYSAHLGVKYRGGFVQIDRIQRTKNWFTSEKVVDVRA